MARIRRTNCCGSVTVTNVQTTVPVTIIAPVTVNTSISVAFPEKFYDYAIWAASTITGSETVFKTNIKRQITAPLNFSGWRGTLDQHPTSSTRFTLYRKTSVTATMGTLLFTASNVSGVWSSIAKTSLNPTDQYIFKAPATVYGARGLAVTMLHTARASNSFTGSGSQSIVSGGYDVTSVNARFTSVNARISSVSVLAALGASSLASINLTTLGAAITSVNNRVSNVSVIYLLDILALEALGTALLASDAQVSNNVSGLDARLSNVSIQIPVVKLNAQANGSIINKKNVVVVSNTTSGTYTVKMSVTQASTGYYLQAFANSIGRGAAADTKTSTSFRIRTFRTSNATLINCPFTVIMSR